MTSVESQIELAKQIRTGQQRYDYWLMAVAASAIALSIHDTKNSIFTLVLTPLAAAVSAWSFSFYAGCRRQLWIHAVLHSNAVQLKLADGDDPIARNDVGMIKVGIETIGEIIEDQSNKAAKWANYQFRALILGSVFYIAWHLLAMWERTLLASKPLAMNSVGSAMRTILF